MIKYKSGDILREEAEALVNTVNCVGVMGRGLPGSLARRILSLHVWQIQRSGLHLVPCMRKVAGGLLTRYVQ